MAVKRFGVSLDGEVLNEFDRFVEENDFSNRSQALRFIVEKYMSEKKWLCNHIVAGAVVLMFDKSKEEIMLEISRIQNEYSSLILSSFKNSLNEEYCLYVITVMGEAQLLTKLSDKFISIKDLRHGKLIMSRAD
ncbi:MAG: nickel-responsive transcriptional regulator NikR [Bacteroidales bacterium]|nr:nickel-responsive transcriptional regulator NikR [Bacteroidales bacterium]